MAYDDKTMMTDMLSTQKFIASNYNNYAGECATKRTKARLMKILNDEHDIQFKIYESMHAKGWYEPRIAARDKVNEAVQTHISGATNLKKEEKGQKKSSGVAKQKSRAGKKSVK